MIDHSEFPWGPEVVPGLLTPLGVIGWIVAAALLLVLLRLRARPDDDRPDRHGDAIDWKYRAVARAAHHAARADQDEVLKAHKTLREVIERAFGGVERAGGGLAKQMKLLDKARSGERDDHHPKGHGHDGHAGLGGHDHPHDGHGAHPDHGHADHAHTHGLVVAERVGAAAETVHGPNVTVNIGVATEERPSPPEKPHRPEPPKPAPPPLTLKEQLAQLQEALRVFDGWWSREAERIQELRAARDALNGPRRIPPELVKLIEGLK